VAGKLEKGAEVVLYGLAGRYLQRKGKGSVVIVRFGV